MFTPEVSLSFLKILFNYCFCSWRMTSWRYIHLKGLFQEVPCFMGLFEKAEGCRGGAPLMFTPEVSLSFLKILFNYCFCSWRMTSWRYIHLKGLFQEVPCFMGLFEKAEGCRGGAPLMFTPEVSLSFLKILFNYCFCSWRGR